MSVVWIDEEITICDDCEGECEFGHGDRDRAVFCCVCAYQDAPACNKPSNCEKCEKRMEKQ